jgi:hypothetical protein
MPRFYKDHHATDQPERRFSRLGAQNSKENVQKAVRLGLATPSGAPPVHGSIGVGVSKQVRGRKADERGSEEQKLTKPMENRIQSGELGYLLEPLNRGADGRGAER